MTLDPSGSGSGFHACRVEPGWILRKPATKEDPGKDRCESAGTACGDCDE